MIVPDAATENDADSVVHLVSDTGSAEIVTGTTTVSTPRFEVTVPQLPVTVQRYDAASVTATFRIVSIGVPVPEYFTPSEMFIPFLCH